MDKLNFYKILFSCLRELNCINKMFLKYMNFLMIEFVILIGVLENYRNRFLYNVLLRFI